MNKKIVSFIIALTLPLTFLVGCKKAEEDKFVMTEDTTALDGSVEYSARTYKDAFYSTENYSDEYLQNEFETVVKEITSKEDKEELMKLLKSYSNAQDEDLSFVKSCFEKYNTQNQNSKDVILDSNSMYEISSRLYKATLNATKKYYDINDFYIYYKDQLSNSSTSNDDEFENTVRITTIKEYTIAEIYQNAYNNSFISKLMASIEDDFVKEDTVVDNSSENTTETENTDSDMDNNSNNNSTDSSENSSDEDYPGFLELSETVKSQIYDAGVNAAIDFIGQERLSSSSDYCRKVYDALENDNPLGENKEEGYKSFLEGFKSTLENNGVKFN